MTSNRPSSSSPFIRLLTLIGCLLLVVPLLFACGAGEADDAGGERGGGDRRGGPGGFGGGAPAEPTAIPVEVETVVRRDVASYLQTNGTLEAENEVDIVARTAGPIVELKTEEGRFVDEEQLLARIDPEPIRARLALQEVDLDEAQMAFDRAQVSFESGIISQEAYDTAKARLDSARAQIRATRIELEYTEIRAPFAGQIVERDIKFAEYVSMNDRLFRISDFTPLLCPIQVPEKDLSKLEVGQPALITVEAYPGERFEARVLRISPVIEAATGTVKVTLAVEHRGKLRPGMFANVFLEIDRRPSALVVPKEALVLESVGDTVYVLGDGVAERREVELGYSETDAVEVRTGLEEGERVIVVGQDAISDGTPVYVLSEAQSSAGAAPEGAAEGGARAFGGDFDPSSMTAEQEERIRERMRARGLDDEQIEERIRAMKSGQGRPGEERPGEERSGEGRSETPDDGR